MSESITVITLLLSALDRIDLQAVFDWDPYESRRRALPGTRLVKVLVVYQMIGTEKLRGLIRTITEHAGLQAALGGTVALNTLSNGMRERDVGQMVEAWMAVVKTYGPWLERLGRKFARIAVVDASLIKLSLLAYSWAEYRKIRLPGWEGVVVRLVSYQLPDGKLIQVLTERFDLSALGVAQLYKERWTIENWWKWVKQMFKIKRPLGESENALPVQIVSAFVTDLLLRAFKHSSGFTSSLYEFVSNCQEFSLVPLKELTTSALRRALGTILTLFSSPIGVKKPLQLAA
jgi:IS4 transposase